MTNTENSSEKNISTFNKLFNSIDNLLTEEKEQKLKIKLAKEIKKSIFTDEIVEKLNEYDFSGLVDEENNIESLFSSIFPIFVKKDDSVYRLYKHKIEVDLSDEMSDRYIYIFSDGRLTSGIFECFNISDDEYVYGVKRIIDIIPLLKVAIIKTLENFQNNIEVHSNNLENLKLTEPLAEKNYTELINYLSKTENVNL